MKKHSSNDYKMTAVQYYLDMDKPSLSKTCDIFVCSKFSLVRWVNRYLEIGSVDNKPRPEGSYKIRKKHVKYIISLIDKKPTITLDDILSHFHKKFKDITLSRTHLGNIIKYANFTYKKIQHTHRPDTRYNKPINYDEEYKKFYSKIKKFNLKDIISIDETSISVGMSIRKGRKEIGPRLDKLTKDNAVFVKYTLIMTITTQGIEGWFLYKKDGIDHVRLIEFLSKILEGQKNKLVLMDNASSHRNQNVKDFINNSSNDYVHVFTLPYIIKNLKYIRINYIKLAILNRVI